MTETVLFDEHIHPSHQPCLWVDCDSPAYTLKMPTNLTQDQEGVLEQIFQHICESITFQQYVVLDFSHTQAVDRDGHQMLKTLFQAAYTFSVGLGFINLPLQMELGGSLTGLDPLQRRYRLLFEFEINNCS